MFSVTEKDETMLLSALLEDSTKCITWTLYSWINCHTHTAPPPKKKHCKDSTNTGNEIGIVLLDQILQMKPKYNRGNTVRTDWSNEKT